MILREWVKAIEAEGFVMLRHAYLARAHALAFATRGWASADRSETTDELKESEKVELFRTKEERKK